MTRGCHSSCGAIPSELIRCYGTVTKTGAGGLPSLQKVEERGVNAEREREGGGGSTSPYSTAENNNHAVMQHPKHLLGKTLPGEKLNARQPARTIYIKRLRLMRNINL